MSTAESSNQTITDVLKNIEQIKVSFIRNANEQARLNGQRKISDFRAIYPELTATYTRSLERFERRLKSEVLTPMYELVERQRAIEKANSELSEVQKSLLLKSNFETASEIKNQLQSRYSMILEELLFPFGDIPIRMFGELTLSPSAATGFNFYGINNQLITSLKSEYKYSKVLRKSTGLFSSVDEHSSITAHLKVLAEMTRLKVNDFEAEKAISYMNSAQPQHISKRQFFQVMDRVASRTVNWDAICDISGRNSKWGPSASIELMGGFLEYVYIGDQPKRNLNLPDLQKHEAPFFQNCQRFGLELQDGVTTMYHDIYNKMLLNRCQSRLCMRLVKASYFDYLYQVLRYLSETLDFHFASAGKISLAATSPSTRHVEGVRRVSEILDCSVIDPIEVSVGPVVGHRATRVCQERHSALGGQSGNFLNYFLLESNFNPQLFPAELE